MGETSQRDPLSNVRGHRFEIMAENFEDVFWMYNGDFSELLYVNDNVKDLYGVSPKTLAENPKAFLDHVHPQDRDLVQQKLQELTDGRRVKAEYRVNPESNYERWVDVQGVPIQDDNGNIDKIIGASREITQQKQAQKQLEHEKDRFKSIVHLQESVAESSLDLDRIMRTVVDELTSITRADGAVIALDEEDEAGVLSYRAASGILKDHVDLTKDLDESLTEKCYRQCTFKRSSDVRNDDRVNHQFLEKMDDEYRSTFVIPLEYSGECFGVLKIVAIEPNVFGSTEENVLNLLSGMVSASIYQSLQYLEKERYLDQVQTMALTDPLTGLSNRRALMIELDEEIDRARRSANPFSIGILDLDHFKDINDTYGHLKGDEVLEHVARILRTNTRSVDTAGRYGGEEFALVLPDTKLNKAEVLLRRVLKNLRSEKFTSDGSEFGITASVGLTQFETGDDLESLIQRADNALYDAKDQGRDQIVKE